MKEELILKIVHSFYEVAKKDFMIGYHFRFIANFEEHIPRIAQFWNLQINQQISDRSLLPFDLLGVHKGLGIKRGEIGRWIVLFEQNLEKFPELSIDEKKRWMDKVRHFSEKLTNFLIQP